MIADSLFDTVGIGGMMLMGFTDPLLLFKLPVLAVMFFGIG